MLLAFRVSLFQCISYRSRARRLSSGPLRTGREGVCRLLSCVAPRPPTPPRRRLADGRVSRLERHCDSAVFVCVACLGSPRVFARAVEIGADTTLSVCKVIPLRTRVYSMGGNGASEMRPAVVTRALHTHHLCRSAVLVAEAPRLVTLRIEVAVEGAGGAPLPPLLLAAPSCHREE